jgi:hypothetical protein
MIGQRGDQVPGLGWTKENLRIVSVLFRPFGRIFWDIWGRTSPFVVIDQTIPVFVDMWEEAIEPGIGDTNTWSLKSGRELVFIQTPIVVLVDRRE